LYRNRESSVKNYVANFLQRAIIQSVHSRWSTNRLIRGNRTDAIQRCGSYSVKQDRNQGEQHGFPHLKSVRSRNGFEDTCNDRLKIVVSSWLLRWNRQQLISAVGITEIPRTKSDKAFSDKFFSCLTKLMRLKRGHGFFDDVESPTGETMLIGSEYKEEIECELFWLEVFDPFFGSQSMIEPGEGSWDFAYAIWNDWYKWLFKRHSWFSKCLTMSDVNGITCCIENRHAAFDWGQKLKKLASLQLAKPSDLYYPRLVEHLPKSARFAGITATEVGRKTIGRRFKEEDSTDKQIQWGSRFKSSYPVTLYQPLI